MSTVSPAPLLLSLVHLNMRHIERIDIQSLNLQEEKKTLNNYAVYNKESSHKEAALLSAFFRRSKMNLADLAGQRPWPLEWRDLACAVRPTPPQYLRKGMACLWAITSSRYLLALASCSFLMAKAVSRVFWTKWVQKYYQHVFSKINPPQGFPTKLVVPECICILKRPIESSNLFKSKLLEKQYILQSLS